jgi:hypothetical protein
MLTARDLRILDFFSQIGYRATARHLTSRIFCVLVFVGLLELFLVVVVVVVLVTGGLACRLPDRLTDWSCVGEVTILLSV